MHTNQIFESARLNKQVEKLNSSSSSEMRSELGIRPTIEEEGKLCNEDWENCSRYK